MIFSPQPLTGVFLLTIIAKLDNVNKLASLLIETLPDTVSRTDIFA